MEDGGQLPERCCCPPTVLLSYCSPRGVSRSEVVTAAGACSARLRTSGCHSPSSDSDSSPPTPAPGTEAAMAGDKGAVQIRTRKFIRNALLSRRQFVVDVIHPDRANVSKAELQEKLAEMYKVNEVNRVILFGFRTAFGGTRNFRSRMQL